MKTICTLLFLLGLCSCRKEEVPQVLVDAPVAPIVPPRVEAPRAEIPPPSKTPLERALESFEHDPALRGAAVGFCLLDERGAVQADLNASTAFIPASAIKTLTTATALEMLGPQFVFRTELRATAAPREGVIDGDVVLLGGGDPTLDDAALEAMAMKLKQSGVQRITGRVRGDGSLFQEALYNDHWNWGDIGNGYGSPVCGLNVNHNRWAALLMPGGRVGDAAALDPACQDAVPGVRLINEVKTGPAGSGDGVMMYGGEMVDTLRLRGTVPQQRELFQVHGALPDPVAAAVHFFVRGMQKAGIRIGGEKRPLGTARHTLHQHDSLPLADLVKHIHETSDNQETECVFRMLGVHGGRAPAEVIRAHWRPRGLDLQHLRLADGCGLARADYITPHDLAQVQHLAALGSAGGIYRDSLPARDGLRWKGGAMSAVRTWAGYVRVASGRELAFALMVNHFSDTAAVEQAKERLMRAVAVAQITPNNRR